MAWLVVGVVAFNLENIHRLAILLIGQNGWGILMAISFFLVWNRYPRHVKQ